MQILETIRLGLTNLRLHLLRSILTALGIILGVAAVITMVSIGEGSKREALLQIERLGALNIIVRSQKPADSAQPQQGQQRGFLSRFGLTRDDVKIIQENFGDATAIVPVKEVGSQVIREERRKTSQAFGTTPELLKVANLRVARGRYLSPSDIEEQALVVVLGAEMARQLFPFDDPLGETMRIDSKAFTVIGILADVGLASGRGAALIGRDLNLDAHIPITTALSVFGDVVVRRESGSTSAQEVQVAEIYIGAPDRERVMTDAARVRRLMETRHPRLDDVQIIVPYELLEQARRSALTWNLVLGAIAGISLLVGGIGIMNIMLATVTERTREIGIRRALGATRKHIVSQFLVETGVLSSIGGLLGVAVGIGLSFALELLVPMLPDLPFVGQLFDRDTALPAQITPWSIFVAFGVAAATGLIFGLYPARKAAQQDPIVALRHD